MSVAPLGQIGSTAASADSKAAAERQQIATAAREFEAMFLLQMLKQMRQSMLSEESDEPGLGAATMLDTFDSELARHLAGKQGGLSKMLETSLTHDSRAQPEISRSAPHAVSLQEGRRPGERVSTEEPIESSRALPAMTRLEGRVSSEFGWRQDPLTGAAKFHRGMDIAAAYGSGVPAAAEGTVVFAGTKGAYGKLVIVRHEGGTETRYAHLSQLDVREGDVVKQGELVGRVGQTGKATGPHLHFEVRDGGEAVDPADGWTTAAQGVHD